MSEEPTAVDFELLRQLLDQGLGLAPDVEFDKSGTVLASLDGDQVEIPPLQG